MARSKTIPADLIPVDNEIDKVWGEPVVLKPMVSVSGGYRDAVPDPNRQTLITRGVFDQERGAEVPTGGGIIHSQATVNTRLSIRHEPVDQVALTKGDRVFFPDREQTYEVTFVYEDPGGRPDVHLVRVLEDE